MGLTATEARFQPEDRGLLLHARQPLRDFPDQELEVLGWVRAREESRRVQIVRVRFRLLEDVRLESANPTTVRNALVTAWRNIAPKTLAKKLKEDE